MRSVKALIDEIVIERTRYKYCNIIPWCDALRESFDGSVTNFWKRRKQLVAMLVGGGMMRRSKKKKNSKSRLFRINLFLFKMKMWYSKFSQNVTRRNKFGLGCFGMAQTSKKVWKRCYARLKKEIQSWLSNGYCKFCSLEYRFSIIKLHEIEFFTNFYWQIVTNPNFYCWRKRKRRRKSENQLPVSFLSSFFDVPWLQSLSIGSTLRVRSKYFVGNSNIKKLQDNINYWTF